METDLSKGNANGQQEQLPNGMDWSALSRQADKLFGPLTEAEAWTLSNSIIDGDSAWFDSLEVQDVSTAEAWPSSRTIRATFLRWICATGCKHGKIGSDGIKVGYARIVGRLVLDFLDCSFPLALRNCFVPAGISLRFATFGFVDLRGSRTRDIIAHRLTTSGSLLFNKGLTATDGVDLSGVKIGISIFFDGSHVGAAQSNSIEMSDAEVGGSLTLRSGFTSRGTLKLYGVKIGASVDMSGGKFIAKRAGVAIEINFTSVGSSIRMCGGFRASGAVRIFGGSSSEIFCDGGRFSSRTPYALLIEATRVSGSLMLRSRSNSDPNVRRTVMGGVRLFGVQINGSMELTGSYIKGIRGRAAFELLSSKIGGSLLCNNGFRSSGNLLVSHSSVGGSVDFTNARLASKIDDALYLLTTEIGDRLYFNGQFRALGQVRIVTGAVRAGIVSAGGRFASRTASALLIDNVEVKGPIILRRDTNKEGRNFRALGGVLLYGGTISGDLDISGSHFVSRKRPALHLIGVKITGTLLGYNSCVIGLSNFSHITVGAAIKLNATTMYAPRGCAFEMNGCRVDGPVVMGAGFRAVGQVHLEGCSAGSIEFNGGCVAARTWPALLIHGWKIDRYINLCALKQYGKNQRFRAIGGVQISATTLTGDLVLSGAYLSSKTRALSAEGLKVGGSILMNNGFRSHGLVLLSGIVIQFNLVGKESRFEKSKEGQAIFLINTRIGAMAHFGPSVEIKGCLSLHSCTIAGNLNFYGTEIRETARGTALALTGVDVAGSFDFGVDFLAVGQVIFNGGSVGTTLVSYGGRFIARNNYALWLQGIKVHRNMVLHPVSADPPSKGFRAIGGVYLHNCTIDGDLDMRRATLLGAVGNNSEAFDGPRLRVMGSIFLSDRFLCRGKIDLSNATIADQLIFREADVRSRQISLNLRGAKVGGAASFTGATIVGDMDLTGATIARLEDDEASWPDGELHLHGLAYQAIVPHDAALRLRWLALQPRSVAAAVAERSINTEASRRDYTAQPYEQLVQTLRKLGHERDARKISIGKESAIRRSGALGPFSALTNFLYGVTMRYGFRPQWSLWYAPVFVLGLALFLKTGGAELMVPAKETASVTWKASKSLPSDYPAFDPLAYSVDSFVPFLKLQQQELWKVDAGATCNPERAPCGRLLRIYMWIHTIAGWAISTLTLAGFTGLIRKG